MSGPYKFGEKRDCVEVKDFILPNVPKFIPKLCDGVTLQLPGFPLFDRFNIESEVKKVFHVQKLEELLDVTFVSEFP